MKKTVIVNGERRKVEFEYRVTDRLISRQKCRRYDRRWGWIEVDTCYHEAVAVIDGVEYPSTRRWHTEGGRYSEQFSYNGHFFDSHKKLIEKILASANDTENTCTAPAPNAAEAKFRQGQWGRVRRKDGTVTEGTIRDWDYNGCTFEREYILDHQKEGRPWTMIGIPEANIEAVR